MVEEASAVSRGTPAEGSPREPCGEKSEKNRVIDRVFPAELRNFLKVLCGHQDMGEVEDVFEAYHAYACEQGRQSASNVVLCDGAGRRAA